MQSTLMSTISTRQIVLLANSKDEQNKTLVYKDKHHHPIIVLEASRSNDIVKQRVVCTDGGETLTLNTFNVKSYQWFMKARASPEELER